MNKAIAEFGSLLVMVSVIANRITDKIGRASCRERV